MSVDKASDIIEMSCCGQGLPIGCGKFKLAEMVKSLEDEVDRLNLEIMRIQANVNNTSKKLS